MKLYYSQGACSLAPHIILEELGIPYTAQQVVMDKGENERPEFLKLNPMGAVPVLETTDGKVITEGVAIQQYLADLKPELNLAPRNGTFERTQLHEWLNFISTEIHKSVGAIFSVGAYAQSPAAQEEVKTNLIEMAGKKLDVAEKLLGTKKFAMGDTFTIADAYLFTIFSWTPYVGLRQEKWPNLVAHSKRVMERPAVRRTMAAEELLD
ncbi:MAG: glutathione S-transferase N-terminal domain-containing protein [Bdellovibrionales bacterium]|nr:glutathione S-transferase N-terminal domain-containing protein [Bdellovibrionales bacterium]